MNLDSERLSRLVFELFSQLHGERLQRLALQTALERAGMLDVLTLQALARDPALRAESQRCAEESVAALLRVLIENEDERTPLRAADLKWTGGG
ncbi:MAG: hypothetical protein ABI624_00510 [Casimicrobiaceae bacterium]